MDTKDLQCENTKIAPINIIKFYYKNINKFKKRQVIRKIKKKLGIKDD
jgi:hypothetical protein